MRLHEGDLPESSQRHILDVLLERLESPTRRFDKQQALQAIGDSELWREALSLRRLRQNKDILSVITGLVNASTIDWLSSHLSGRSRLRNYSRDMRVILVLLELRAVASRSGIASLFRMDKSNLTKMNRNTVQHLVDSIRATPEDCIHFVSAEKLHRDMINVDHRVNNLFRGELMLAIDGTSLQTYNSQNPDYHRMIWVHYKHHSAWRWSCICSASGRILWISPLYLGKLTDEEVYKIYEVEDVITNAYDWAAVNTPLRNGEQRNVILCADQGYKNLNKPKKFKLIVTASGEKAFKKERKAGDVDEGPEFSNLIAAVRSVIERVFGALKRRHPLLAFYEGSLKGKHIMYMNNLIYLACTMLNKENKVR